VSDAWIISSDPEAAGAAARAVADMGLRPLRVELNGGAPSPRVPVVVVVIGSPASVRELSRHEDYRDVPVVLALAPEELAAAEPAVDVAELLVRPFCAAELRMRVRRARKQVNGIHHDDRVRVGSLELDLATYAVTISGEPVEFTYMEYELLRFLATHPNRVFSREALLSRVWGYDYYGGARTVDVHVRRVRAKLGPEHARRLKTVRSVGYGLEV
jgi:DNA-binding response OmpR family regulator